MAAPPTLSVAGGLQEDPLDWKFVQSFGDDNSSDDDLVTAVEFDETGQYLAVGDKAGRICIFEGHQVSSSPHSNKRPVIPLEYKFYTEFQSHEPEFDCLKSLEIEEKINMIKWGKKMNNGLFLLACNDKTIKYWKVHEKKIKRPARLDGPPVSMANTPTYLSSDLLNIPKLTHHQTITTATPKRVYSNAHGYHVNSISINSDGETFISADDLRINLWNLQIANETFNVVDVKPPNLEELTEVITSATFHPQACSQLIYSSSRGSIRLADLRDSALCDQHAKLFEVEEDPSQKSFFSEIISSISDAQFIGPEGRFILSRDYLTLKVWDVQMESRPLAVIPIHEYLKVHLCDLYENDCIFDKFEAASSADGSRYVTGSYNNHFVIHHTLSQSNVTIEALKDPPKRKPRPVKPGAPAALKKPDTSPVSANETTPDTPNVNLMDFGKKALHVSYHPSQHVIAVAGLNKLYIYQAINANL